MTSLNELINSRPYTIKAQSNTELGKYVYGTGNNENTTCLELVLRNSGGNISNFLKKIGDYNFKAASNPKYAPGYNVPYKDYSEPCPEGWTDLGYGQCNAPQNYSGSCNGGLRKCHKEFLNSGRERDVPYTDYEDVPVYRSPSYFGGYNVNDKLNWARACNATWNPRAQPLPAPRIKGIAHQSGSVGNASTWNLWYSSYCNGAPNCAATFRIAYKRGDQYSEGSNMTMYAANWPYSNPDLLFVFENPADIPDNVEAVLQGLSGGRWYNVNVPPISLANKPASIKFGGGTSNFSNDLAPSAEATYGDCPDGWTKTNNGCCGPPDYRGPCNGCQVDRYDRRPVERTRKEPIFEWQDVCANDPPANLNGKTPQEKQRWETECNVLWPTKQRYIDSVWNCDYGRGIQDDIYSGQVFEIGNARDYIQAASMVVATNRVSQPRYFAYANGKVYVSSNGELDVFSSKGQFQPNCPQAGPKVEVFQLLNNFYGQAEECKRVNDGINTVNNNLEGFQNFFNY